jgi:hypothetical protein
MKNVFVLLGVILLVGIGVFVGKGFGDMFDLAPTWDDQPIKKVNKHVALELTRNWSKTIEDRKPPGRGIIEYRWHFTYMFGVDIPENWDWQIERENGVLKLKAPPLKQLNEPLFSIDEKTEFNEASGNRQQRMDKKIKTIGLKAIRDGAKELLTRGSFVRKHAEMSFGKNLLALVNQANPENLTHDIIIEFAK